jgi:hypothetical protein
MAFQIRKISNHGAGHPVVARLAMQTAELVKFAKISEAQRGEVMELYFHVLQPRLLKCHDLFERMKAARDEAVKVLENQQPDNRVREVPHVIGLKEEAETYLYEAKNFLRDTLNVLHIFFGDDFPKKLIEASSYYDAKNGQKSALVLWGEKYFGPDDKFTQGFVTEQSWIEDIIRLRNAIEHPGGSSGTMKIYNVEVGEGGLHPPTWERDNRARTDIYKDIETGLDNMLTLAEDLLIGCIVHRPMFSEIVFAQLPPEKRNPEAPQRIIVQLSEKLRATLPPPAPKSDPKPAS